MEKIVTVGRRKRAIARVTVRPGTGTFTVNKRTLEIFFPQDLMRMKIMEPFTVLDKTNTEFDISVNVDGGGINGQAEAIRLGLARALNDMDREANRPALKVKGLLTRDARVVERKKYGKPKARKSTQFSKR
ncbi:MAG: 30S ribosomal protein S9 [Bacteroidia bacterium]